MYQYQERSGVLATYMLCGLSNLGCIGITIGAFVSLAPQRIRDVIKHAPFALLAGNFASFSTACVAGECIRIMMIVMVLLMMIMVDMIMTCIKRPCFFFLRNNHGICVRHCAGDVIQTRDCPGIVPQF